MKTKLLSILAILFCGMTVLQAQDEGGTSFGIRAGVNFQNINGKDSEGNTLENDLATRFHVGANVEFPVAPDFYLQPGVLFSTKGAKSEIQVGETLIASDLNLAYIEVPINFLYKPMLGTGHLILGLGPYVAFGIDGKVESGDNEVDVEFRNDAEVLDGFVFRRMDYGANLLAGYEFANRLSFQLNAQLGLADINPDYGIDNDDTRFRHTGFGLSLGYRF